MSGIAFHTIKAIWVTLCVAVLISTYLRMNPNSDLGDIVWLQMSMAMIVLSFPLGLVASICAWAVLMLVLTISSKVFEYPSGTSVVPSAVLWLVITFLWLAPFVAGYLQWFWLLPRCSKRTTRASNKSLL